MTAETFRALGLREGSRVVVHSSLRAVGAGAAEVLDALLAAIGPEGLLVAPTFTYASTRFDPRETPGRTGALAEALRRRPGAARSLHPFYSLAALGPGAAELVEGHELRAGTDVDTPLDRLARGGGDVLLLGVGQTSNTTVHVGEFRADAPYLDIPFDPAWPREAEVVGRGRVAYDRFPGCSRAFAVVERGLRERGQVRDGRIGRALVQLVPGAAVIDEAVRLLRADPAALLCSDPACHRCSRARARLDDDGGTPPPA